ncbi:hypothetical protein AgCh_025360 [Apium graveolens]
MNIDIWWLTFFDENVKSLASKDLNQIGPRYLGVVRLRPMRPQMFRLTWKNLHLRCGDLGAFTSFNQHGFFQAS